MTIDWTDLDVFTTAYLDCALWSSLDDDDQPMDDTYGIEDLSQEALTQAIEDCEAFQLDHNMLLDRSKSYGADDEQNGHDFWLTRNHHGAGFWDRGYPEDVSDGLTDAAHAYGSADLYVGDDGLVHMG